MAAAALAFASPVAGQSPPPRPDIVIERWSTPSAAPAGLTITVVVHVANTGQSAAAQFVNELRLDPPPGMRVAIEPARWETAALQPGRTAHADVTLLIPRTALPGEYVLRVLADVTKAVSEGNEHNNLAERRLIVLVPPGPTSSTSRFAYPKAGEPAVRTTSE